MRLTLLLLLLPLLTYSQLNDNFDDGDFTNGTEWEGDTGDFRINTNKQLQLNSTGEGSSFLSTALNPANLSEWNFLIKLGFSPSDNNQCIVYLVTNHPDPELCTAAFYLKFGKSGSDDAIELYKQIDTTHSLIASGDPGFINTSFCIRVKITRDDGYWQILADSTGGYDFRLQATANDDYWGSYNRFSILCRHTSSNATKFYFDDIYAGPMVFDVIPPSLAGLALKQPSFINLTFNEPLMPESCSDVSDYHLEPVGLFPAAAGIDPEERNKVHLLFDDEFAEGEQYGLMIKDIRDVAGNRMKDTLIHFTWHHLKAFDAVISEIMADPAPPAGLPDCEYTEIYNRTSYPITTEGWHFITGDKSKPLPSMLIPAYGYIILAGTNDSLMESFGSVARLPGMELPNSGCLLCLTDENGAVLHAVSYEDTWYDDRLRENGGWSLEMIDPMNPCSGEENWRVSIDPMGGTPGKANSVKDSNPDNGKPLISFISMLASHEVTLHFNEPMDSTFLSNPLAFKVESKNVIPKSDLSGQHYEGKSGLSGHHHEGKSDLLSHHHEGAYFPHKTDPAGPLFEAVTLEFPGDFQKNIIYDLSIMDTITDCCGNMIPYETMKQFAVPYDNTTTGIIINEILYDASTNGAEFIEIFNRTDTAFHLKDLLIASLDPVTGEVLNTCKISESRRILMPHAYLVLTDNPAAVRSEYFTPGPVAFIRIDDFPSLSDQGGKVALLTKEGLIIDKAGYSDEMHFALLQQTKGVSLERVNPAGDSGDGGNWHSASQSCGFATPGYRNSQYLSVTNDNVKPVTVSPQTFSPDNDGYNDILTISYTAVQPGDLLTIRVFNADGRQVKLLAGNYLTGNENLIIWDGITDEGGKAPAGIYIIHSEVFNLNGEVRQYKNVAVVATR